MVNELRMQTLPQPASKAATEKAKAKENSAFLESYFNHFIEGTEFGVQEAHNIVLMGKPCPADPRIRMTFWVHSGMLWSRAGATRRWPAVNRCWSNCASGTPT
jgi:hypothetical protein